MKRFALVLIAVVVLLVVVGYNVWRANQEPVATPPSLVELGHQRLHSQLDDSKSVEAQIEKQDWDSPALLQQVIEAHQQRIDKLKDNSQAGEIVAHDREAIDRLQKRIAEIHAQAAAQAAEESATTDQSAPSAAATDQGGEVAKRSAAAPSGTASKASQPSQSAAPGAAGTAVHAPKPGTEAHPMAQTPPRTPPAKPTAPKSAPPTSPQP